MRTVNNIRHSHNFMYVVNYFTNHLSSCLCVLIIDV